MEDIVLPYIIFKIGLKLVKLIAKIDTKKYMRVYTYLLKQVGVIINEYDGTGYIDPTCYIDSSDYSLISIGSHVTISRSTTLLTHDFSIGKGLSSIGEGEVGKRYKFLKKIVIGEETFIGLNAIILPGTTIGKYCVIGSGAVVKGTIPDYSICVGNPAEVIADTRDWAKMHMEKKDYL